MNRFAYRISPTAPYDFALTVGSMTYFQARHAADMYENGEYRRVLTLDGAPVLVSVPAVHSEDTPELVVDVIGENLSETGAYDALRVVRRMLSTDANISAFYAMALDDPHLAPLVRNMRGLRPTCAPTAYEALVLAILGQQISTHVARMLRNLIIETYGERILIDGETLRAFPRPQALADAGVDGLRAIKFSRRKAEYISSISERIAAGELSLEAMRDMPDDEIVGGLMALRGVGAWTAHWMLIRAFGRQDGFPHGDLALQRMMGVMVGDGAPMPADEALAYSERWSPWRSWVTAYMFGAGRTGRFAEIVAGE
ncbi:MAG: DNA-3-methyladenine glycosylase 2 family protein [Chloroflexi bacterium]|nr:DNA-3-methyladenine glycosylase 2 family protein [Chloroflexota bacterium]